MAALKMCCVFSAILMAASYSQSKSVSSDNLSEIDRDLASILTQAEEPADANSGRNHIDKTALKGFVPASQDAKIPETDKTLLADDEKSKLKDVLEKLLKDEDVHKDVAARFGSKNSDSTIEENEAKAKKLLELLDKSEDAENDLDEQEKRAKKLLEELDKSQRDSADEKEKEAKKLLELLKNSDSHDNEDKADEEDPIPKEILEDLKADHLEEMDKKEKIAKVLLDALRKDRRELNEDVPARELMKDFESDLRDNSIPKELLDDLNNNGAKDSSKTDCGAECKKNVLRTILMDELASRMTSIVKRGEKIPRRMFELWSKYRTKRDVNYM